MKTIELSAATDLGRQRKDNQDIFICTRLWSEDQGLIGVIDGVGGYEGGDIAAKIAKESIEFYMASPKGDILPMLKEAVVLANNQIVEAREKDEKFGEMCCVLTVAVADARQQLLYYVHVGDTRLYRCRKGGLEKITKDHSLVGVREDAGTLTESEAMQHPRRNVILRQVGTEHHRIDDTEFLEFGETEFLPGDEFMICSDGLSDMVMKEKMASVFRKQAGLQTITAELIAMANEAGGLDNITVAVARNISRRRRVAKEEPVLNPAIVIPSTVRNNSKIPVRRLSRPFFLSLVLSGCLLLTAFWVFTKKPAEVPKQVAMTKNSFMTLAVPDSGISRSPNNNHLTVSHISAIDSLQISVSERKEKELILDRLFTDTILLSHPIRLGSINKLTGGENRQLVLMPGDSAKGICAIEISSPAGSGSKKDRFRIKNIRISGFETGIRVAGHIELHLDNVIFANTQQSVSYQIPDSVKSGLLTF